MKHEKSGKRKRKCQGIIVKRRPVLCEWGAMGFEVGDDDTVTLFTKARGVRIILFSGKFERVALQFLELCANFNRLIYPELVSTQRRDAVAEAEGICEQGLGKD